MNVLQRNNVHVLGQEGPVLLYAHGFGCSQAMWSRITPAFADTHRQVLFDYVGSGQSERAAFDATRYASLHGYAQDVIEICDALGLHEGVTWVGHSVSASIGMLASIARPGLFDRLVLLGPSPCFINHPPDYTGGFEQEDLEGLLALMDQNYMGWANYLAPVVAGASGTGAVAGELSDSFCSTDPVVARVFAQATFFADNRADLPKVTCPSLILQHATDALAPLSVGEYLHQHLRGSTLKVLGVSGHCAHLSNPALVIEAMRDYLGA
jgi:sigma-B regulation protein RsbQ